MDKETLSAAKITEQEWEQTPESVKKLIGYLVEKFEKLEKRITELEEENKYLREQLRQNSSNSSNPPSTDRPSQKVEEKKKKSGKSRGGQKGHPGHRRELIETESCDEVKDYVPEECGKCGEKLEGQDLQPYRHQVVEVPEVKVYVEEHRLHQLECKKCGELTRAKLPEEVEVSGYGVRVVAIVALLSGVYRMSERMLQTALCDLFGVAVSLGTVNKLRQEASQALAEPVKEAEEYVKKQNVIYADETSFSQANSDGKNPNNKKAWLWTAVTSLVTIYQVSLSRCQEAAKNLLGEGFSAILVSDRYNGYNWVALEQRQICWAHLKRDFIKISEREGKAGEIGKQLLELEAELFTYWHKVRDKTLTRTGFIQHCEEIREKVKNLLQEGASYQPTKGEKSALAQTSRTCKELLKLEPACWLFVKVEGLEPTNNVAERAIRPAVLWRKNSFGTQSLSGSVFVARIFTVVMTLRSQQKNILDFMVAACRSFRDFTSAPSLLPTFSLTQTQICLAA